MSGWDGEVCDADWVGVGVSAVVVVALQLVRDEGKGEASAGWAEAAPPRCRPSNFTWRAVGHSTWLSSPARRFFSWLLA